MLYVTFNTGVQRTLHVSEKKWKYDDVRDIVEVQADGDELQHCKLDSTFTLRDVEKVINKIGLKGTKPSQLAHNLKRDGYIRQMGKGKFEMRWTTVTQLIKLGMFV